jgi:ABC-type multidrug transport system ATPase subunit
VLDPWRSIHAEVVRLTEQSDTTVKNTLIKTGFAFDRHSVLVNTLSGGEKSRIIFCILYMKKPNFIILDEPTNHIDLDGKNELANSLKESNITALITGHDRFFIEEVADRYVLIDNGRLFEVDGPEVFYQKLLSEQKNLVKGLEIKKFNNVSIVQDDNFLERILELEEKIEADLKRKPKFQKLKLQENWQGELRSLYQRMGK